MFVVLFLGLVFAKLSNASILQAATPSPKSTLLPHDSYLQPIHTHTHSLSLSLPRPVGATKNLLSNGKMVKWKIAKSKEMRFW